jgi:hypothetical protein
MRPQWLAGIEVAASANISKRKLWSVVVGGLAVCGRVADWRYVCVTTEVRVAGICDLSCRERDRSCLCMDASLFHPPRTLLPCGRECIPIRPRVSHDGPDGRSHQAALGATSARDHHRSNERLVLTPHQTRPRTWAPRDLCSASLGVSRGASGRYTQYTV